MYHWNKPIRLTAPDGESVELEWKITFFRVPCTARPLPENPDAPEWNAIPAIPLTSRYVQFSLQNIPHGHPGDLEATFRAAWDEKNFYVMIDAKDDKFQFYPEAFKNGRRDVLYLLDGCAELYFDTGANALLKDTRGYDLDDYRYDFGQAVDGADGSGSVWRLREPTMQLMAPRIPPPTPRPKPPRSRSSSSLGSRFPRASRLGSRYGSTAPSSTATRSPGPSSRSTP